MGKENWENWGRTRFIPARHNSGFGFREKRTDNGLDFRGNLWYDRGVFGFEWHPFFPL